jgi:hypothetical protein
VASEFATFAADMADVDRLVMADAQTSGGLLIAVSPTGAEALVKTLTIAGEMAATIGHLRQGAGGDNYHRLDRCGSSPMAYAPFSDNGRPRADE